ncbi:hypothetical protein [Flavobacterium sp.]|uniref:hypothetical protein n=1 Tax=Flavobacterium sp. TaxID=239 RepID=UPI002603A4D7|nr:hypothetical protein [Flavobacterium sp.]
MKKAVILFFYFITFSAFSQELVKDVRFKIPKKSDVFQIIEENDKRVSLFFCNKKNITSVRFNERFEIIDSLAFTKPEKNLDEIVGYSISNNKYYTYWASSNNKEFVSQCFDYGQNKVIQNNYALDFEKEKAIKKITINNVFYLVTVSKSSSILNFYVFNEGSFSKKVVDMSERVFYNRDNKKETLWNIFGVATTMENPFTIQSISNDSPASLTFSACKRKCYSYDNEFVITLDNNKNCTQYISVNLLDFTFKTIFFNQPTIVNNVDLSSDSNSFFIDKNVVQMKLNSDNMAITVKDLDNKEIKSYKAFDDKEVEFKNSEIYQENKGVKNLRVLDNSNQLLHKIYFQNPSMSCYNNNGVNYITLGSISTLENNNAVMYGGMIGGFTGALIGAALTSNYSMNNVNSYQNRKVVYVNCLFDTNFNHVTGDAKKLAFDKLRNFIEDHKELENKTAFKFDSALFFGGFNKETDNYSIYKFID